MDGCITNDGDAFLYGARTVFKDLCISGKVGSDRYCIFTDLSNASGEKSFAYYSN